MCFIGIILLDSLRKAVLLFQFDSPEKDETLALEHSGSRWENRIQI